MFVCVCFGLIEVFMEAFFFEGTVIHDDEARRERFMGLFSLYVLPWCTEEYHMMANLAHLVLLFPLPQFTSEFSSIPLKSEKEKVGLGGVVSREFIGYASLAGANACAHRHLFSPVPSSSHARPIVAKFGGLFFPSTLVLLGQPPAATSTYICLMCGGLFSLSCEGCEPILLPCR